MFKIFFSYMGVFFKKEYEFGVLNVQAASAFAIIKNIFIRSVI